MGSRFQVFSPPSRGAFHLSLTVLVHYRSPRVFSLGGWSPLLPTGFLVPRGTRVEHWPGCQPSPTGLSPSPAALSRVLRLTDSLSPGPAGAVPRAPPQPPVDIGPQAVRSTGFGLRPFRSPLLRASLLLPLPRGTEMFQFPRFPSLGPPPGMTGLFTPRRVSPFGHPGLRALDRSPGHFAALPRPSSALGT